MSKPQKIVIKLGMPSAKNRTKAMELAAKVHGVSSVVITGADKDQLEVVGVGVDTACMVLLEEVKDKKKEQEEKPKELPQRWWQWPGWYCHPAPPPMVVCEEPATGCHIM